MNEGRVESDSEMNTLFQPEFKLEPSLLPSKAISRRGHIHYCVSLYFNVRYIITLVLAWRNDICSSYRDGQVPYSLQTYFYSSKQRWTSLPNTETRAEDKKRILLLHLHVLMSNQGCSLQKINSTVSLTAAGHLVTALPNPLSPSS